VLDVLPQRRAQFLAVLAVQIDLIVRAVEGEPHRTFGLAAIEIVNEQRCDLLRHIAKPRCA
jgi:hypothetical protein